MLFIVNSVFRFYNLVVFFLSLFIPTWVLSNLSDFQKNKFYNEGLAFSKNMSKKAKKSLARSYCQRKIYKNINVISSVKNIGKVQEDEYLVFISFSIPDPSLKSLAESLNILTSPITLLMVGLFNNSFQETAVKIKELNVPIDINPQAFEDYHITKVPTFIRLKGGREVARLSGNVTLHFAIHKLKGISK